MTSQAAAAAGSVDHTQVEPFLGSLQFVHKRMPVFQIQNLIECNKGYQQNRLRLLRLHYNTVLCSEHSLDIIAISSSANFQSAIQLLRYVIQRTCVFFFLTVRTTSLLGVYTSMSVI
jgi:hypothetical protein